MIGMASTTCIVIRSLVICTAFLATSTTGSVVTARGKTASASSVHDSNSGPEKAIDGNTYLGMHYYFKNDLHHSFSWWRVNLGQPVISPRVTIYFRSEDTYGRNGAHISLSQYENDMNSFCEVVTGAPDGSNIPNVYDFTCSGYGRFLSISTATVRDGWGAYLQLGEVELYACSLYTFGPYCQSECHCASQSCDWTLETPVCTYGCRAGWKRVACDELITAAEVSVYTKHAEICDIPVSYHLESVALTSVREMEKVFFESRMECLHNCEALVLCISFEYTSPTCTLWRSGSSGLSGSRDMWKK